MARNLFEEFGEAPEAVETPAPLGRNLFATPAAELETPTEEPTEPTIEALRPAAPEDQNLFEAFVAKMEQVPGMMAESIGGTIRFFGELEAKVADDLRSIDSPLQVFFASKETTDRFTEVGRQLAEEGKKEVLKLEPAPRESAGEQFFLDVTGATANMIPAVVTGLATGPAGGASVIATQVFGKKFADDRADGRSLGDSSQAALFHTAAEAIPEMIPLSIILKPGKTAAKRILNATFGESIQEGLTAILQDTYDEVDLRELTLKEAIQKLDWKNVGYQSLVGAFTGGTLAAGTHSFVKQPELLIESRRDAMQESGVNPTEHDLEFELEVEKAIQESTEIRFDEPLTGFEPLAPEALAAPDPEGEISAIPETVEELADPAFAEQQFADIEAEIAALDEQQPLPVRPEPEVDAEPELAPRPGRAELLQKELDTLIAEQERAGEAVEEAAAVEPVAEPTGLEAELAALEAEAARPAVEARPEIVEQIAQGRHPEQLNVPEIVEHINQRGRQELDVGTVEEALGGAQNVVQKRVPLAEIHEDVTPADPAAVEEFRQMDPRTMPLPVLGPDNNIIDGRHRIAAAKARGDRMIEVYKPDVVFNTRTGTLDLTERAKEVPGAIETRDEQRGVQRERPRADQIREVEEAGARDRVQEAARIEEEIERDIGEGVTRVGAPATPEQIQERVDRRQREERVETERRVAERRQNRALREQVDQLSERFTDEEIENFTRALRRNNAAAAAINPARQEAIFAEIEADLAAAAETAPAPEAVVAEPAPVEPELEETRAEIAELEAQLTPEEIEATFADITRPSDAVGLSRLSRLRAAVREKTEAAAPPAQPPKGPENVYPNDVPPGQPPVNMEPDLEPMRLSLWDRTRKKMQDRMIPLLRVQRRIQEGGARIGEDSDAYMAEELMQSRTQTALKNMWNDDVLPILNELGEAKISREEFNGYLYAKHAAHRNAVIAERNPEMQEAGSGMTDEQAEGILAEFEEQGKTAQLESAAQKVYDMMNEQRDLLVSSGLETQATIDEWRETHGDTYVPLKTTTANGELQAIGRGVDTRGKNFHPALGRASEAQDIFSHAVVQMQQTIIKAEKNHVGNTFLRLVQQNPSHAMWEIDEQRTTRRLNKETGEVETGLDHTVKYDPNVFITRVKGKEFQITLKDEHLARAMKNMGIDKINTVSRVFSGINRYLAMVNTSLNPEFAASNFARDVQTAMANIISEQEISTNERIRDAKALTLKVARDIPQAMRGAFIGMMNPDNRLAVQLGASKKAAEWKKWFDEFAAEGGKIEFFGFKDIEQVNRDLLAALNRKDETAVNKIVDGALKVKHAADIINGAVENATRLATYKNLREAKVSKKKAANVALNLTVNFYKKGELGSAIGAYYLFYNAGVQGAARIVYAMKSKKLQALLGGITMGAFTLAEFNRYIGGEDEESGESYYDSIPDHVKRRNMIIMTGEFNENGEPIYTKLPLPYGYNVPHVIGTQASAMMHGKGIVDATGTILSAIMESFNPIGGDDNFLKQFAPTVVDPFIEIELNEDFASRALRPEPSPFNRVDTPDSQLYWQNVNPNAKLFTQKLNELTGGNEVRPGWLDISPESLEHLGAFAVGGAGQFIKRGENFVEKIVKDEELDIREVPFARRFIGTVPDTFLRSNYFEAAKDVETRVAEEQQLLDTEDFDGADKYSQTHEKVLGLDSFVRNTDKQLKILNDQRKDIERDDSLNDRQRELELDAIEKEQADIYADFLKEYNEAIKNGR